MGLNRNNGVMDKQQEQRVVLPDLEKVRMVMLRRRKEVGVEELQDNKDKNDLIK